ncbi:MAG: leucine-rich repeat protein [Prevotella sp.]|nr:leucine-rich repeat protein [Prevotella sp.]
MLLLTFPTMSRAYTVGQIVTIGQNTYQVLTATAPDFTLCFLGTTVSGELVIPATVDDGIDVVFTITEVGGNEAYKCPNVTSVVLPETVTKIKSGSFTGAALESLYIPKSVIEYSYSAGYTWKNAPVCTVHPDNPVFTVDSDGALYSKDMTGLYNVPSSVALDNGTYTVAESVTDIYWDAFLQNRNLTKLILPPNLQSVQLKFPTITYGCPNLEAYEVADGGTTTFHAIDGVLFNGNTLVDYPEGKKTTNYTVPDGITEIATNGIVGNSHMQSIDLNDVTNLHESSILNDYDLKTVVLPKNLQLEGIEGAIAGCMAIEEYVVPDDCVNFAGVDGVVFSKDMKTLYFYPPNKAGESYDIPTSVEKIGAQAFRLARNITTLEVPKSVTEIGKQAFRDMRRLETATFAEPASIEGFGDNIFMDCHYLTEVTLPSSLTRIDNAYYNCENLKIINVPDGSQLRNIAGSAFTTNKALEEFNFLGSCELKTIGSNAFANLTNLTSFDVPKTVTQISANAFSGCSSLATVTFAEDAELTSVHAGAFADCGLTAITIPESLARIGAEVFRNCAVLETVNLSANVTYVDSQAFKYCNNLAEINVDKDNTTYSSVDGYLLTADKETLVLFPPGKANSKFTLLPPSITKIGDYAFYACEKLENVIIPNKVNTIGKRAFGLCTNLNTITFLSDEVIDPANIDQEPNSMSFDDGTNVAGNQFEKIDTYVRPHLQEAFRNNEFYQKFRVVGTSFKDGDNEYLPVSENTVDLLAAGTKDYTFVIPTTATGNVLVSNDGTTNEKTYNVGLIGDYAFQNTTADVHEVVVKNNVEYIGAKAFMTNIDNNSSTIENVFFIESNPTNRMLGTTRFELDETGNNYNEFAASTNVYVKKSALDTYTQAWTKTTYDRATHSYLPSPYDFTSQIDYRIPGVNINNKYATFAREFDTDFSDYFTDKGNLEIAAFVAAETGFLQGHGDYGTSEYRIRMSSIDENGGNSSCAYVPANTGVLLKVLDQDATVQDFYYTIGEQDNQAYNVTGNIMTGVTVNPANNVEATTDEPIYVMQGGVFRPITSTLATFPVHKAYMKTGPLPSGAKVVITFDEDSTTGIDIMHNEERVMHNGSDAVYDLNGRRTGNNVPLQKGIYIYKGKKIVINQ